MEVARSPRSSHVSTEERTSCPGFTESIACTEWKRKGFTGILIPPSLYPGSESIRDLATEQGEKSGALFLSPGDRTSLIEVKLPKTEDPIFPFS